MVSLSDSQVLKRGRASSSASVGIPAISGGAGYRCGPAMLKSVALSSGPGRKMYDHGRPIVIAIVVLE